MEKLDKEKVEQMRVQAYLRAENARLRADLDYIQIMSGIEIPTEMATEMATGGEVNERMV